MFDTNSLSNCKLHHFEANETLFVFTERSNLQQKNEYIDSKKVYRIGCETKMDYHLKTQQLSVSDFKIRH